MHHWHLVLPRCQWCITTRDSFVGSNASLVSQVVMHHPDSTRQSMMHHWHLVLPRCQWCITSTICGDAPLLLFQCWWCITWYSLSTLRKLPPLCQWCNTHSPLVGNASLASRAVMHHLLSASCQPSHAAVMHSNFESLRHLFFYETNFNIIL